MVFVRSYIIGTNRELKTVWPVLAVVRNLTGFYTPLYAEPAIGGNTPRFSPFDANFKEDIMASGR